MDFTLKVYRKLLTTLIKGGFNFQSFKDFIKAPQERVIILRHDVDLLPNNSLATARIESEIGVIGTYYFRVVAPSFDTGIIREIYKLGHEIGYHYENMHTKGKGYKKSHWGKVIDLAYKDFRENLERMRKVVPVQTIAMHGSPHSPFNNLDIWKKFDYRVLGIIGEPYLDIDFSDVFYLTDTGRCWDGGSMSIRDKVKSGFSKPEFVFRSTYDLISAAEIGSLPSKIMINVHPQRWTDSTWPWLKEFVWQNAKNQIKRLIVKFK